ncbi:YncE family protein [Brevibacillus sp. AG]|uniref:YncE family protein n=1 Tax=Brevibacillus sp. AG TaxID=3020891 RepID=UPI00232C59EC|nr:YncE family protein [Brevibacillus sp. AG]MDC0763351.1 YncE family protein [Brevibacillus sp. AG]
MKNSPCHLNQVAQTNFQDLRKKLKRLQGQFISLTLSGCCDSIQGSVFRVDKGSVILTGDFGTRMIPICAISSIDACRVYAYVTNSGTLDNLGNTVSVIDTATNTVITIQVGVGPAGVGIGRTPVGTSVYVLNSGDNTISVIDADPDSPTFNTVITTITKGVGNSPSDADLTPDARKVYVPNNLSNNVSVINTITNTIITSIPVGNLPNAVAVGQVCSMI